MQDKKITSEQIHPNTDALAHHTPERDLLSVNHEQHTEHIREQKQKQSEGEQGPIDEIMNGLTQKLKRSKQKTTTIPQVRDQVSMEIEKVMEEGLEDAFKELTPVQQQEFKLKGEETAFKVRDMLKSGHVKVKKIFRLILEWLRLLPGINRFFLEQEAKIKTDKIITLSRSRGNRK